MDGWGGRREVVSQLRDSIKKPRKGRGRHRDWYPYTDTSRKVKPRQQRLIIGYPVSQKSRSKQITCRLEDIFPTWIYYKKRARKVSSSSFVSETEIPSLEKWKNRSQVDDSFKDIACVPRVGLFVGDSATIEKRISSGSQPKESQEEEQNAYSIYHREKDIEKELKP